MRTTGMTKRRKPMTDEELLVFLEGHISQAVGYEDGELSKERRDVIGYYRGDKPVRAKRGGSTYISTDVYDAVEAMHAQLLEVFAAGNKVVRFAPQGPDDTATADAITEYCDYVVFRQNTGYSIFSDIIKDGLMARQGIAKIWWAEKEELVEQELPQPIPGDAIGMMLDEDPELDVSGLVEVAPNMYQGVIRKTVPGGKIRIEVVPPHEFLAAPKSRSLEVSTFVCHRTLKCRAELLALGMKKADLDEVMEQSAQADDEFDNLEDYERFKGLDDSIVNDTHEAYKRVWLHEAYIRADLDYSGEDSLWMVQKVNDKIIRKERVQRHPFVIFTPIRMPHSMFGSNYAARTIPTANSKTALMRAILDHTAITVAPRYTVVTGGLPNPNELMDNRMGGIVNVRDVNAVTPLIQPPLNPYVFQSLQLLDADLEDTSGISRLSQGLSKDAVSKQNSAALVEQLTTNSQTRQKIIARNFAEGFLIPLYQLVSDLVVENEQEQKIIDVAGQWQPVDPKSWGERRDVIAEVHLGYGEQEREIEKWMMLHQLMAADPMIGSLYGYDRRFNLYRKVFELKGVKDIATYLPPPEQAKPQPDPAAEAQQQMAQKEMELKERKMALEEQKFQLEQMKAMHEMGMDKSQLKLNDDKFRAEHLLDISKYKLDEKVSIAEVEILKKAQDTESLTAIASPNS